MQLRSWIRSRIFALGFLFVAGFLVFGHAIRYPFVHEDIVFIPQNPHISRWDNITDIFKVVERPAIGEEVRVPYYRPLLEILYRVQYFLFGPDPAGFHSLNIVLHVLNAFLVFLLAGMWRMPFSWSLGIALIFLVHPVQSEAVVCVSGISNLVVTVFVLGAVISYIRARSLPGGAGWLWGVFSGVLFVCALGSKEQAVMVPVFLLIYELAAGKRPSGFWCRWVWLAGMLCILGVYFLWRLVLFPGAVSSVFDNPGEFLLRLASIPRILIEYFRIIFWPADLHYYRSVDILAPKLEPVIRFLIAVFSVVILWFALPGRMRRWARLGTVWFSIFLLPVLNIVPLVNEYSLVLTAEHFLYLPLAGFLVFCAAVLRWIMKILSFRKAGWLLFLMWGLVLGCLALITVRQSFIWRGEVPLFERTIFFQPGFGRGHLLLGGAYAKAGQYHQALESYARGLRIMEDYVKKAGSLKVREVYLDYVQEAHFQRAECYRGLGLLEESNREYGLSLLVHDDSSTVTWRDSRAANNMALNFLRLGDRSSARRSWERAIRINPHSSEIMNNLGMFFWEEGEKSLAVFWLERAVRRDPLFRTAWDNLKRIQDY